MTHRSLLQGDFNLSFESKGGGNFAIAELTAAGGRAILVTLPKDDAWHTIKVIRKRDKVVASIDGKPVNPRLFNATAALPGHFLISVLSNKTVAIREFKVETK